MEKCMSSDITQGNMLTHQLDHDRKMRVIERLHDLIVQGGKGLAVLNGGAVVSMLAFVQALVDKPAYQLFKPYAIIALSSFLFGAFFAAITFVLHHHYVQSTPDARLMWRNVVWGALATSASAALIGGAVATIGIWVAV